MDVDSDLDSSISTATLELSPRDIRTLVDGDDVIVGECTVSTGSRSYFDVDIDHSYGSSIVELTRDEIQSILDGFDVYGKGSGLSICVSVKNESPLQYLERTFGELQR